MEIQILDNSLRKAMNDAAVCRKRYGAEMAKKIALRLAALRAASSLADFWPPKSGPERCHELQGEMAGTFSVDLKQPYRLLFQAAGESTVTAWTDQHQRWKSIT